MKKMMKKSFVVLFASAALALTVATPARADVVTFDNTGGGGGESISAWDILPGNSMSMDLNAFSAPEDTGTLLFQANMGSTLLGSNTVDNPCDDGVCFTVVAGFDERVFASAPGVFLTFVAPTTDGSTQGFFNIYAQGAPGDNLAGTCFAGDCGSTLVLSGQIINDTTFFGGFLVNPQDPAIQDLDQFEGDSYVGTDTIVGGGNFTANILITFAHQGYFPGLEAFTSFLFATSDQSLPYKFVDPSACFSNNGTTSCNEAGVSSVGAVNGISTTNTMLETDGRIAFEGAPTEIPEPATLTLLGLGLLGGAAARRRQLRKRNSQ